MTEELKPCRVCDKDTDIVFNINLKRVFICDKCAALITMQNVTAICSEMISQPNSLEENSKDE